jgi:hypothetical protein
MHFPSARVRRERDRVTALCGRLVVLDAVTLDLRTVSCLACRIVYAAREHRGEPVDPTPREAGS